MKGKYLAVLVFCFLIIGCDDGGSTSSNPNTPNNPYTPSKPSRPSSPSYVTATPMTTTSVSVSWDSVSDAKSYKIFYRATTIAETYTPIGTMSTATSSAPVTIISGLKSSTTYLIWVKAINSAGESGYSPMATVTTKTPL